MADPEGSERVVVPVCGLCGAGLHGRQGRGSPEGSGDRRGPASAGTIWESGNECNETLLGDAASAG